MPGGFETIHKRSPLTRGSGGRLKTTLHLPNEIRNTGFAQLTTATTEGITEFDLHVLPGHVLLNPEAPNRCNCSFSCIRL